MILVDTSVLIDFFKGTDNEQGDKFEQIIKKGIPFGINNLIYLEVLQGAKSKKEFTLLDSYLSTQTFYKLVNGKKSYQAAALIAIKCRAKGLTIRSTIDLLIAQTAIENHLFLLHNDHDFTRIASIEKKLKEY